METDRCPRCLQRDSVAGECWGTEVAGRFLPDGGWLPAQLARGVALAARFRACRRCGLVWSEVSPERLAAYRPKEASE